MITKEIIASWFQELQDDICAQLESLSPGHHFVEDKWKRPEGGGGRTRVIKSEVFAKGGVNFSQVAGPLPPQAEKSLGISGKDFFATGVSIVLHPINPWVPIIHMNVRYFEMDDSIWWFGGGIDLTPHIVIPDQAKAFHQGLKNTCDAHSEDYYPQFKTWADDYFYLPHRKETRGVGGIFFDRLSNTDGFDKQARWDFVKEVGQTFCKVYIPIVKSNLNQPASETDKQWQMLRRGRYTEFNLVWDRGTKFGLHTNGRTESILMSLPPVAHWEYNADLAHKPPYKETQEKLIKGIDWINMPVS